MRFWTLALTILLTLTLLPPPLAASPAVAPDLWSSQPERSSSGDGLSTLNHMDTVVANDAISVSASVWYLRNLQFPLGANNTFLETSGGGQAYALRYGNQTMGAFFGNLVTEGYRSMDDGSALVREASRDGIVSVVTQVTAAPGNTSAIQITHWVRNNGNDTIPALKIFGIAEPNANSQNEETTTYQDGVLVSTNAQGAQALLGFAACGASAGHGIGTWEILYDVESDTLNQADSYTGDSFLAQAQQGGALGPGGVASFSFVMRAAPSGGSVADAASHCPAAAELPPVDFLTPTLPEAPTNLTATGAPGRIDLTWEDGANPPHSTAYVIYRGDGGCDNLYPLSHTYGSLTYEDHYVDGAVEYCYGVRAYNTTYGFESALSNTATATALSGIDLVVEYLNVYPGSVRGDGDINLLYGNAGPLDAWYGVEVVVEVCPVEIGSQCEVVGSTYLSEMGAGQYADTTFEWDTLGMIGDFTVCAKIVAHGGVDGDSSNNERCENAYFVGSGLGVGLNARR